MFDELPVGERIPVKWLKPDPEFEITHQEGEFDDESEEDETIKSFLKIQSDEKAENQRIINFEKKQRFIRLHHMWIKILDHYSRWLNKNEVTRIAEGNL